MSGHPHQNDSNDLKKTLMFTWTENQLYPSLLFRDIAKILKTFYFGFFQREWSYQ